MSRPKKIVDLELLEKVASCGCMNEEIADICNASIRVIERRFAAPLKKGRSELKKSLRAKQGNGSSGETSPC